MFIRSSLFKTHCWYPGDVLCCTKLQKIKNVLSHTSYWGIMTLCMNETRAVELKHVLFAPYWYCVAWWVVVVVGFVCILFIDLLPNTNHRRQEWYQCIRPCYLRLQWPQIPVQSIFLIFPCCYMYYVPLHVVLKRLFSIRCSWIKLDGKLNWNWWFGNYVTALRDFKLQMELLRGMNRR